MSIHTERQLHIDGCVCMHKHINTHARTDTAFLWTTVWVPLGPTLVDEPATRLAFLGPTTSKPIGLGWVAKVQTVTSWVLWKTDECKETVWGGVRKWWNLCPLGGSVTRLVLIKHILGPFVGVILNYMVRYGNHRITTQCFLPLRTLKRAGRDGSHL